MEHTTSNFDIQKVTEELDQIFKNYQAAPDSPAPNLYEPISYILSLGGKRIRPVLTLLGHFLYTDRPFGQSIPLAKAVEIFHNFSLMHDDIMDKAPLRRGKPTVHKQWNDSTAILSGDVMLVKAYDLLLELDDELIRVCFQLFGKCAAEVCEGQQLDMDFEQRNDVSEEEYIEMIRLKTAVLLGFALQAGALSGGTSLEQSIILRDFGIDIGLGFQLKDDLLDVYGDQSKFGKQVGGDIISNKKTFLLINALNKAEGSTADTLNKWIASTEFDTQEKVTAVTAIYDKLDIKKLTEEKITYYFNNAFARLEGLDILDEKRQYLELFTKQIIDRDK